MIITLYLNGKEETLDIDPSLRLIHILRNTFGLLGTKEGCLHGHCGYCLVFLNDQLVLSCLTPAFSTHRGKVLTIEGFRGTPEYYDIEKGFLEVQYTPCGFCASARILLTHAILQETLYPTEQMIRKRFTAILCRCTDPSRLVEGVQRAAAIRRHRRHAV